MTQDDETHLFVVRVWADNPGGGERPQWRGKAQNVLSTSGGYFADWPALIALLQSLLPNLQIDADAAGETANRAGPAAGGAG